MADQHLDFSYAEALTREEVEMRKRLVGFTDEDARLLSELEDIFRQAADAVVDNFYAHIIRFSELANIINKHSTVERLKKTQKDYFIGLASGKYDVTYFRERLRIGKTHDRIRLKPKHYIAAYAVYYNNVLPLIENAHKDDPAKMMQYTQAFLKIINLDMQLAIESYIASFMEVNSVISTLQEMSEKVSTVSKDLATSTGEISIASDELAHRVVDISAESQSQADNAFQAVTEIKHVADSNRDSMKRIQLTVDTINKIASQTNLLALNATIEAARAGEHGRSFSVVAQEVKKLAVGSAKAARDIGEMVREVQLETDNSSQKTVELINNISHALKIIAEATQEASASTEEQSATIHELANSAQILSEITDSVEELVVKFKEKVD